ncbi:type IV pilus secretin PilQ [Aquabacterium lacunae]|uniref:Type IV pilus biogenesis and competence protein PilQ n=1 Tax=Aquabacterium lacunae TaxID=2528630 RepID=A0A4Q9H3X3_9BURK|nr:type IV pilus secretin PilQ [Aquabacterium lacunae]
MSHRQHFLAAVCSVAFAASAVQAAPAIQSVTASQVAGTDVLRIELSEPLASVPSGFVIQSPARVAIDLPGVSNGLGRGQIEVNQGNVRTVNVAQAGERTRLVLNLRNPSNYTATIKDKFLIVTLDNGTQAASDTAAARQDGGTTRFAEARAVQTSPIKDLDFRRGQDGAGRVVVELPNSNVGVDIRQQGKNLVVEFAKTSLPEKLRRRFDVNDFGTPVQSFSATQVGDRVKLVIDPRGDWEHSAYQSDNQFVLEVRKQKIDPNKLTQGPGYAGDKLSLNFQNIEVRALLQVIADFTNFNVVTSDSVTGNVTLRLKDVPWDQALDIILQSKGLGVRKSGNVLWVAPKDEINAKEKMDLEAKAQVATLEPLRTQSFQLNYVKAEELSKGLIGKSDGDSGTSSTKILSPRGSVLFETRTNQIFVNDIPSKLEEIQQLIAKIDIPVRQVMIEARIVEADDKFGRSLGAKLGAHDMRGYQGGVPGYKVGGSQVAVSGTYLGVGEQTLQAEITERSYLPNTYFVNLPAAAQNGFSAASVALSLFGAGSNRFLNLELSALEADGRGRIVSSPRVITADQVKALIEQGTELPYLTASSSGATSITFRKANLKLEVTPQITPEGGIILDVDVNKDSVGIQTPAGYAIDTKHVQTQVLVENGGTVVIGGIFIQEERNDEQKVPLIGDLPVVGHLFKNTAKTLNKSELLIFLTPRVVSERSALR